MSDPTHPDPVEESIPPGADASGGEPLRLTQVVRSLLDDVEQVNLDVQTEGRLHLVNWLRPRLEVAEAFKDKTVYRKFAHEVRRVHNEALPNLIRTYVPEGFRAALRWRPGMSRKSLDPIALIKAALGRNGTDAHKSFEAKRDLSLGYYFLWLVTDAEKRGAKLVPQWNEKDKTKSDRERFLEFLRDSGVIVDPEQLVAPLAALDPQNEHRCVGIVYEKDGQRVNFVQPPESAEAKYTVDPKMDLVTLNAPSGTIPALFIVRRKGVLQTVAKMLSRGIANPRSVPDRRGIRFCYRSPEELKIGAKFISERIGLAIARKEHTSMTDLEVNRYAAPNLVIVKDSATYLDREIEIQNFLATQHVDLILSHGAENATRYHRRQYTDPRGIFPQLFPPDLYGVDWQDPDVQAAMDDHILAPLPK